MQFDTETLRIAGISHALGHHTARQLTYYAKPRQWVGHCAGTAWLVAQLQLALIEFYPSPFEG